MRRLVLQKLILAVATLAPAVCESAEDPPEVMLGERLFQETRFAQFFASHGAGGDPTMDVTETRADPLPGAFAGTSMNCAACHLVDQQQAIAGGGMRSYSDFARRSPLQPREDGRTHAVRNSPALVNASLGRKGGVLMHFDGEFATLEDLVAATFTGRMMGWLPGERGQAVAHIARIIRADEGSDAAAAGTGGSYATVFGGVNPALPLRLPKKFRLNIGTATDLEVFAAVVRLTSTYVASLEFARDKSGAFYLSPYDRFLKRNGLPRMPNAGESNSDYSERLLNLIIKLEEPKYIHPQQHAFKFHMQPYQFGPRELAGMKAFFAKSNKNKNANCVSCHPAPNFTDFAFHNTGVAQAEYDAIHGEGAFNRLPIPSLRERNADSERYVPATVFHSDALEAFRAIPSAEQPGYTDLGLWNIFANVDFPRPQKQLKQHICAQQRHRRENANAPVSCTRSALLPRTIALFKTPGLRDLGHSAPYMHNGSVDSLEAVLDFYKSMSALARDRSIRNVAPELQAVTIEEGQRDSLAAFLRSLNEDYE